jgi:hypothetical protein
MPERIQLRRTKGWRLPEGAVTVARPTKYGNPFPIDGDWAIWTALALGYKANPAGRRQAAVSLHRAWATGQPVDRQPFAGDGAIEYSDGSVVPMVEIVVGFALTAARLSPAPTLPPIPDFAPLRGLDLACWCPLDQPCHADVLLELANA